MNINKWVLTIAGIGIITYMCLFKSVEGFSIVKRFSELDPDSYPRSVEKPILDSFPLTGSKETSLNNYNQIWWHYPVFSLGSYEQITNNIRHNYNPDEGTCIRADFCGALYKDKHGIKSNVITPLPPAEEGEGARVGYFRTEPNELFYSIPTNENILY